MMSFLWLNIEVKVKKQLTSVHYIHLNLPVGESVESNLPLPPPPPLTPKFVIDLVVPPPTIESVDAVEGEGEEVSVREDLLLLLLLPSPDGDRVLR